MDAFAETAAAEFARSLPVVHFAPAGCAHLRQGVAIAGRWSAGRSMAKLLVRQGGFIWLESHAGALHVFRCVAVELCLDLESLDALVALADEWYGSNDGRLAQPGLQWRGRGWSAEQVPTDDVASTGTVLIGESQLAVLDATVRERLTTEALAMEFERTYPALAENAGRTLPRLAPALERFIGELDPATVLACERIRALTAHGYNAFACAPPRSRAYRRDAAEAMPLLARIAFISFSTMAKYVVDAIDRRLPLIDAAARLFAVPKETVKSLAKITIDEPTIGDDPALGSVWDTVPDLLLSTLSALPPEHRPRREEDWLAFYWIVPQFLEWDEVPMETVGSYLRALAKAGWSRVLEAHRTKYGTTLAISNAIDFLRCAVSAARQSAAELTTEYGVRAVLDMSAQWHRLIPRVIDEDLGRLRDKGRITLPIRLAYQSLEHEIVFLDSYDALREEGLRMSHCVAQLYLECCFGERLVFSLSRERDGDRATFDISIDDLQPVVNEIRGPDNEEASGACRRAAQEFIGYLRTQLRENPAAVDAWRERKSAMRAQLRRSGVDELVERAKQRAAVTVLASRRGSAAASKAAATMRL